MSVTARALLIALLFAALGLCFALCLPSHRYGAALFAALALVCGLRIRN